MMGLAKKTIYPAGIELSSDYLKVAQLGVKDKGLYLNAAVIEACPEGIKFGSGDWQRWVVDTAKKIFSRGGFSGKGIVASIPSEDIFVDHIRVKCAAGDAGLQEAAFKIIANKLPFNSSDAMINYIVAGSSENGGETDVVVMAAEREIVNRQLAIYEKAGLEVRGISVWPLAMATSYAKFFGKRQSDADVVSMLIDVDVNHSKIVIAKEADLLFARIIPFGSRHLSSHESSAKFVLEAEACCRYFGSFSSSLQVSRLVFFTGRSVDEAICAEVSKLAERLQIPAQIGDVLAAVDAGCSSDISVDRQGRQIDWSIAFGLSLSSL
ncbi:MAG: pilus assembly protein PilM [Phycisphaerae bacterium]|nr:pilus assembly protein PilM [Phycisphaerae bacterium]